MQINFPGTIDELGVSHAPPDVKLDFEVPAGRSGTRADVGSLALMLVVNGFVNGETVLIDGGVSV